MDDSPDHLVRVVELDGEPQQILRVDLVSIG